MIRIDHVMFVTANIERTAQRVRQRYALGCIQGGLHPDGTRTWAIPFRVVGQLRMMDSHQKSDRK